MDAQTNASFGTLLRDYRLAAGLTQEGLAERAGISARTIRLLEHGGSTPQRVNAQHLASALRLAGEHVEQFLAAATPSPRHRTSSPEPEAGAWTLPPMGLVGRSGEIAAVLALLQREQTRLLTLIGPGGVGKTRVALAVALQYQEQHGQEVIFVALAALDAPELVLPTIARAAGVPDDPSRPILTTVISALRDRHCLLVLDNFEHLAAAAVELAALRAACPRLRLLVTSRIVLHVQGEQVYPVPPLALAAPQHLPPLDVLRHIPAVQLFIERAQAVKPDFTLTAANAEAVAQVCAQLDGLPLAIELAARRAGILPVQALLQRLQDDQVGLSLQLLTGDARNLPERQQTVHATIAWSYALLPELERALFQRLGVFRGGWSLEAAEAICADLFPLDALDGLSSLVEQSLLVVRDEGGEPRFGMLETIREYALEQLEAHGEGEALRQQHTRFFLEFVESAEPELTGSQQAFWMVALEAEHDNLRAALRWSLAHAPEGALRLSGALWRFWYGHTHLSEGRAWLEAAIARRDAIKASSAPYLAKALHGAGVLSIYQNDMAAAHVFLEEAQAIQREQGDSGQLAFVLHDLGGLAQCEAEYGQATALYEESLTLFRAVQNQWGVGVNLYRLGTVALAHNDVTRGESLLQGSLPIFRDLSDHGSMAAVMVSLGELAEAHEEYRRAADYAQAGLALYQEVGNKHGVSWALSVLGDVAELEGDSRRARSYYEEGVVLARESGSTLSIAAERGQLGCLAYDAGDYEHALVFAREELALVQNIGRKQTIIACLEAVAAAASGQGRAAYAACVWGAMQGLREAIGNPRASTERARYERGIARARRHGDEAVWAEAWAKGRAMSMAQAIAYALDPNDMIATSDGVPPT